MSVLIKGAKMPLSCYYCPFLEFFSITCKANKEADMDRDYDKKRADGCPLVEVTAHGDLIDMDERIDVIDVDYDRDTYVRTMTVAECLDKAGADRPSVIIEAEDGE